MYDLLLVFQCNYVTMSLSCTVSEIAYFPKFKDTMWPTRGTICYLNANRWHG